MPKNIKPVPSLELDHINTYHDKNLYVPTRTIYFGGHSDTMDEVDSVSISQTIKNLQILENKKVAPITFYLNSCGGEWESGIAVYDIIKLIKSKVTIIGLGKLYSMGSVIFQAGNNRYLTEHTDMLIHNGLEGFEGDAKNYERWAENSKNVRQQMYQIYYEQMKKKNPKITLKKIENMCNHDTILSAKEAIKLGLADNLIGENNA